MTLRWLVGLSISSDDYGNISASVNGHDCTNTASNAGRAANAGASTGANASRTNTAFPLPLIGLGFISLSDFSRFHLGLGGLLGLPT